MAVVLLGALGFATGCGVPTSSDVRVDGPPADAGGTGSGGEGNPPRGPDEAATEEELVNYFLQAAASDPETMIEDLRAFIHSDDQAAWQPDQQVYVVREQAEDRVITPGDPVQISLRVRRVGILTGDGVIDPRPSQEEEITFHVTTERASNDREIGLGSEGYRLLDPPPYILLDDSALERHFQRRLVYFWDGDEQRLVPDLRWLRRVLPERQRPQTVVDWLLAGPSPWLTGQLTPLPEGVERVGNVVWADDNLEIRLSAPHDEVDLRKLEAQLWWTLRPDLDSTVEVTMVVDGEPHSLEGGYRASHPVPTDPPASFAVLEGAVWQYVPTDQVSIAALRDEVNSGIERAAVSRDGRFAALVRADSDGGMRLSIAEPRDEVHTDLVANQLGRPVWLNNPTGSGLVVADGELKQFTVGRPEVVTVELTEVPGEVTAVAAAPDGRRIALVVGGRLYVASVTRAGETITASTPLRPLPTTATDLDGVAFLRDEWLAVVGTARGQSRLYELTVDGALERELPDGELGNPAEITNFVAYPGDPTDTDARGSIMYEAGGFTWRYAYPQEPVRITAADLFGEDPPEDIGEPRAPFFLE